MQATGTTSVEAVPITYAQKFIHYVLQLLGPQAPLLQLTACMRVRGPIDELRFARATAALVSRHQILCSRLELSHGELFQRQVGGTGSFELVQADGDTDHEVDKLLSARADEPLDLFQENPLKVVLVRTHPSEAFLMLLAHHMYVDAAALQALLEEYVELVFGDPAQLNEAPRSDENCSYLSYARGERQMIHDGTYPRRAQYWLGYLEQADPVLRLPDRGPDPALQSLASIPFSLDHESLQALAARSRRLGVTPFALTTATILHSLRQATTQDDLTLEVVVDARRRPFERTIGTFADTFVIRQREENSGLSDNALRTVYREILGGMKNLVPSMYFADHLDWIGLRFAKGFAMNEVNVNYVPIGRQYTPLDGYEISRFNLTARTYPDIRYHGVVMRWLLAAGRDSLAGSVLYETALVKPQVAQTITDSWIDALCGRTLSVRAAASVKAGHKPGGAGNLLSPAPVEHAADHVLIGPCPTPAPRLAVGVQVATVSRAQPILGICGQRLGVDTRRVPEGEVDGCGDVVVLSPGQALGPEPAPGQAPRQPGDVGETVQEQVRTHLDRREGFRVLEEVRADVDEEVDLVRGRQLGAAASAGPVEDGVDVIGEAGRTLKVRHGYADLQLGTGSVASGFRHCRVIQAAEDEHALGILRHARVEPHLDQQREQHSHVRPANQQVDILHASGRQIAICTLSKREPLPDQHRYFALGRLIHDLLGLGVQESIAFTIYRPHLLECGPVGCWQPVAQSVVAEVARDQRQGLMPLRDRPRLVVDAGRRIAEQRDEIVAEIGNKVTQAAGEYETLRWVKVDHGQSIACIEERVHGRVNRHGSGKDSDAGCIAGHAGLWESNGLGLRMSGTRYSMESFMPTKGLLECRTVEGSAQYFAARRTWRSSTRTAPPAQARGSPSRPAAPRCSTSGRKTDGDGDHPGAAFPRHVDELQRPGRGPGPGRRASLVELEHGHGAS
jgi:hypothetical protein